MRNIRNLLLLLMIPSLLMVSCKKDEEEKAPTYKAPVSASMGDPVTIPSGLQAKADAQDFGATMAVAYIEMVNAFSSFGTSFTVPSNAQVENKKGSSTVYHWSYGGFSYWMTYEEQSDKYVWKYDYQTPELARFTFISAEEAKTGKSGNWKIYDPESTSQIMWTYTWSISAINTYSATLEWHEGSDINKFEITSLADHSGTFKYYLAGVKIAEVIWASNGSGSYWLSYGNSTYQGTWTAK